MDTPKLGRYRHYKGNECVLKALGKIESSQEDVAIYQDAESAWWIRPVTEFTGAVEVNGEHIPRFVFLDDELPV